MEYIEPLTKREREVLDLAGQGLSNQEIGETLGIKPVTVQNHLNSIYAKLGVTSRIQAALKEQILVYIGKLAGQR